MRTLSVFVFTFILIGILLYGACAFVTAVPNPMNWTGGGRAAFVLFFLMLGTFGGAGVAVVYEENN